MRKFITASADASIYQAFPTINAGFDEIVEVGKVPDTNFIGQVIYTSCSARTLMNFDVDYSWPTSSRYYVNLRIANANEINKGQRLEVGLISSSWDEGSAYFYQQDYNRSDGVTWRQRTTILSWSSAGSDIISSTTGSYTIQNFPAEDIRIEITDVMRPVVSQSLDFYGVYIKFPTIDENTSTNTGNIKFFSTQTHTIYQPTLEVVWDDQAFITGTLKPIPANDTTVIASNNISQEYIRGSVEKIRLIVRDRYPDRKFNNELRFGNKYYLPEQSYYRLVDIQSNTSYGSFDEYSSIHCDPTGSYIMLNTDYLYRNRTYKIEIKYSHNGITRFAELPNHFTIV